MTAHFFVPFFKSAAGWNVFELFVVIVRWLAEFQIAIPNVYTLHLLRVFRIIRPFRGLESFRRILRALYASIWPVSNACCIFMIVTCSYAVITTSLSASKGRNPAQFGKFSASVFTMYVPLCLYVYRRLFHLYCLILQYQVLIQILFNDGSGSKWQLETRGRRRSLACCGRMKKLIFPSRSFLSRLFCSWASFWWIMAYFNSRLATQFTIYNNYIAASWEFLPGEWSLLAYLTSSSLQWLMKRYSSKILQEKARANTCTSAHKQVRTLFDSVCS